MDEGTNRRKRQRASIDNKGYSLRKRTKRSLKETDSQYSDDDYYSVQTVLAERRLPGKGTEYLLQWDPHPETGETYSPSWEPAKFLLPALLAEWKQKNPKSGDHQADGHVEPRSQAAYVPGGDESLNTAISSSVAVANDSGVPQLDLTTSEQFSASPALQSTALSSPRRAPPNQSTQQDPESPELDTAENGAVHLGPENLAAAIVVTTDTDFPRDEYQAGLSQQLRLRTSQSWPSSQPGLESQATSEPQPSGQPSAQPTEAKTPKVIPDSQSQGYVGLGLSSPTESVLGGSSPYREVSVLLLSYAILSLSVQTRGRASHGRPT